MAVVALLGVAGCAVEADGVATTSSASTGYGCINVGAGEGFAWLPIEDANVLETMTFSIHTSGTVDAVVGFSAGAPSGFSSMATGFRLNPNGDIDVRDGSGYRADFTYAYGSDTYVRMIADVTTHTYSVMLSSSDQYYGNEIARQYQFRTEQQAVSHLDTLVIDVDSPTGNVSVCPVVMASSGVAYSREGTWSVAPTSSGQAAISDGSTTMMLDASNHVLASIARGGTVGADSSGNVFLATLSGTTLTLEKLNAGLVTQWTRTRTLPTGHALLSVVADGSGGAALTTRNAGAGSVYEFRWASDGTYLGSHGATGEAIAVSPTAAFVAHYANNVTSVKKLSTSWATLWANSYSGVAPIGHLAPAPDGGVVFAGNLNSPIDFGGGVIAPKQTAPEETENNDYVAGLSPSGTYVFAEHTDTNGIGGLATNGHWIMVSATYWTQFQYPRLYVYAMDGSIASDPPELGAVDDDQNAHGIGGDITLASDGHFWWGESMLWPTVFRYPYVFAH